MDDIRVALGAFCLGGVVCWLVYKFVSMQTTMDLKVLKGLVGLVGGTAVVTAAFKVGGILSLDFMYYFVGLFVVLLFLGALNYEEPTRPSN